MEANIIIYAVLAVGTYFLIDLLRTRSRRRKEKKLAADFKATYEQLVADHAELYEKKSVPMDDADRRAVNRYHNIVVIILLPFTAGFFYLLYFNSPWKTEDLLICLGFGAILAAGFAWSFYTRSKLLANNEKLVIKGVITNKRTQEEEDSKSYHIRISDKDTVVVSKKDFKTFNIGDIVKLEVIGSLTSTTSYKISLMGRLENSTAK